MRKYVYIFAVLIIAFLSGCTNVKPWEQMIHGSDIMRSDRDPLGDLFAEHVHFTREGAAGGRGVGGGGCGCN